MKINTNEQLQVFDLSGKFLRVQDRKEFSREVQEEFTARGSISKKVKTIRALLMTPQGRIYIQRRSNLKNENSGLYDKTIGGHVIAGTSFELTVVKESAEELGFPASVLPNDQFDQAVRSIDLGIIGVFRKVSLIENFASRRLLKSGGFLIQPYITEIYIGYYAGSIRFADGESSGIEVFSLEELRGEIEDTPYRFTEDLKFMVEEYSHLLIPIIDPM